MRVSLLLIAVSWSGLWLTPYQRAARSFDRGNFEQAAEAFGDPLWQGTAWYRAGEFEKAAAAFSRSAAPEARFNEGNARMLLGKYRAAIEQYDKALKLRPDWQEARENRDLAAARAKLVEQKGGDAGDQREGADEIVFDKKQPSDGQDTEVAGEQAATDATVQSIWLRRVQTKPADFLRSKFAYQLARERDGDDE